jgi:hypothetical protein
LLQYIAEPSANTFARFLFTTQCPIQTKAKLKYANPRGRASRESRRYETLVGKYGVVKTLRAPAKRPGSASGTGWLSQSGFVSSCPPALIRVLRDGYRMKNTRCGPHTAGQLVE